MKTVLAINLAIVLCLGLGGCAATQNVGQTPAFTPINNSAEQRAMTDSIHDVEYVSHQVNQGSLWSKGTGSLFGDRRASRPGDILTVVIEIDDKAEISNNTSRYRTGSESLGAPTVFGLENLVDDLLPGQSGISNGLSLNSSSTSTGDGSVSRNEKLTLRIAATVVERLANGVIRIQGSQEVRVNFEIRELLVSGFVRPADITRKNEVTYDKIASARVSYGGRGLISDAQRPRVFQQASDALLPY